MTHLNEYFMYFVIEFTHALLFITAGSSNDQGVTIRARKYLLSLKFFDNVNNSRRRVSSGNVENQTDRPAECSDASVIASDKGKNVQTLFSLLRDIGLGKKILIPFTVVAMLHV